MDHSSFVYQRIHCIISHSIYAFLFSFIYFISNINAPHNNEEFKHAFIILERKRRKLKFEHHGY